MSQPKTKQGYELLIVAFVIIGIVVSIVIPAIKTRKQMRASALNAVQAKHPEAVRVVLLKSHFVTTEYRTVTVQNKDGSESTHVLDAK